MARPSLKERRRQQAAIAEKRNSLRSWNKANPRPVNKGNASAYNEAMRVWKAKKKAFLNPQTPTAKDKEDAAKEQAAANLSKIKGTTPKDPGPGVGKDGKKRTATLEEDRARNTAPKNTNKEKIKLKPAPWGRNEDGSPKQQPSASSQIATHKKSVEKGKVKGKGPVASGEEYGKTLKEHAAKKEADEKAAWLKKTRRSPAAKAGFSDDERWAQQQKHRKWKADRKAARKTRGNKRKLAINKLLRRK